MNKFLEKFKITERIENSIKKSYFDNYGKDFCFLEKIIEEFGGAVFNDGVFKIHTFENVEIWTKLLRNYFAEEIPNFELLSFASNWQGIMYCINSSNSEIIYFDPATCEFFEADFSLNEFFNVVLAGDEFDIIFEDYFVQARDYLKFDKINYDQSVGHIIYLHLGGLDDVENLEIVQTEILWELQIQIANRINEIPE